jgi:hypothetical protein
MVFVLFHNLAHLLVWCVMLMLTGQPALSVPLQLGKKKSPFLSVEYYQSLLAVTLYLALALASALRSVPPGAILRSSECKASSRDCGSIRGFRCIPYTTSIRINSNKAIAHW